MFSKPILISIICVCTSTLQAQVSNVTWALSPEQDKINIHYDLASDRFFDVYIEALLDGRVIKPINISGDIGKYTKGGSGKKTVWDILRDNLELEGKLEIKVTAIDLLEEMNREEHYQQANHKHKSALLFISTGGAAALFSVYQFIRGGKGTSVSQVSPAKFQLSPHFTTQWHDQQARFLPGAVATLRF